MGSLSARRAWIEISSSTPAVRSQFIVALRKESVDRNALRDVSVGHPVVSLSARRAWIEMESLTYGRCVLRVALRKESVDRNATVTNDLTIMHRRSPQGERG